jgi:large subunit ribosomal protein L25
MLSMSDIKVPEGVEIPALAQGPEADRPVVSIHVFREMVIEEEEGEEGVEEPGAADVPTIDETEETSEDDED